VTPIGDANAFLNRLPQTPRVRLPDLGRAPFEQRPVASLKPSRRILSGATE
jgi:hypothetical protein